MDALGPKVSFNPKREAHPLQTATIWVEEPIDAEGFNPKREAHPLQTGRDASPRL